MTVIDISEVLFSALVLIIAAGVTAHIFHGYGTKKWRESFVGLVLLILVCTQLYYLIQSAIAVPTFPYVYDASLTRIDCLDGSKGGKRPRGSHKSYDQNPCFCFPGAGCFEKSTGLLVSTNGTCENSDRYECYLPHSNSSTEFSSHEVNRFIDDDRNCNGAMGAECTLENPCDPCSRDELPIWGTGRCRSCSTDFKGDCNFVPGVGPYCRDRKGSLNVVPCKKCCTDATILMVDGKCY